MRICIVGSEGIEWLQYQLEQVGTVVCVEWNLAHTLDFASLDWVIFNIPGYNLTRNDVIRRLERFQWKPERTIARFDMELVFHGSIDGLHVVDQKALAPEFFNLIEGVRA